MSTTIKPTENYLAALKAVNEVNKPQLAYTSLTAYKQGKLTGNKGNKYTVVKRSFLGQIGEGFRWLFSKGWRDRKIENRHALLNMIEDEIRTSAGGQLKYEDNGKMKVSDTNAERSGLLPESAAARSRFSVDGVEVKVVDLPDGVAAAIKHAADNVDNRVAFLDALHRVFVTAGSHIGDDQAGQSVAVKNAMKVTARNERRKMAAQTGRFVVEGDQFVINKYDPLKVKTAKPKKSTGVTKQDIKPPTDFKHVQTGDRYEKRNVEGQIPMSSDGNLQVQEDLQVQLTTPPEGRTAPPPPHTEEGESPPIPSATHATLEGEVAPTPAPRKRLANNPPPQPTPKPVPVFVAPPPPTSSPPPEEGSLPASPRDGEGNASKKSTAV